MCDFPSVNLDFNEDGCIEARTIYKITHFVNATEASYHSQENTDLIRFRENFSKENPHLRIEYVNFWGDGDDGTYYHYIDIYFSTRPWYDVIIKRNMSFSHNGEEYLVFWVNSKAEMRLMNIKTKRFFMFNPQTLSITPW